ncbi:MAG TPA: ABC transporter permease [Gemmataceae bacterium]|nr:ABC transporter permease [Gemmataceae bacterium]
MWTLAKKDLRLLLRDPRAGVILLAMPLIFILVLGVSLGEGFGQKPADRLRVSLVDLDEGVPRYFDRPAMLREGLAWLAAGALPSAGIDGPVGAAALATVNRSLWFPHESWAKVVQRDLAETADISVEIIPNREEAERLVRSGRRPAVLIFGPLFSKRVSRSSFLAGGWGDSVRLAAGWQQPVLHALLDERQDVLPLYLLDGINPFHRDGVEMDKLDAHVLRDPTQATAAAIIDQVAQGSMMRVVLPWMIGRAFEKIGDPQFVDMLRRDDVFLQTPLGKMAMSTVLRAMSTAQKQALGASLQNALQGLFAKYNLTAKTWSALTKAYDPGRTGAASGTYREEGVGLLKRGALRYQVLVPSYLVMFAFFLVLTVGWLFVAERRQGTLKRLRAAPVTRGQILLGKLIPCFLMSLTQGLFLLGAGRLIFGMSWGPEPLWLLPLVLSTSLAAMGLALLVAAAARTETQVAIYGTLLVLVLAGLSGAMMGDRSLMPEGMQQLSRVTPHAWALDAYRQLLTSPQPNLEIVGTACMVLTGFGIGFLGLAWWILRLD